VLHLLKSVGMKFLLTIFLCLILANPVYSYTPFPWSGKWDMKVTSNSGTSTQVPIELEHVGGSYVHSLLSDLNMGGPYIRRWDHLGGQMDACLIARSHQMRL
jgi:hypothetical protein